jgi:hypothetical protein
LQVRSSTAGEVLWINSESFLVSRPGYDRHEIEGIGGDIKTKRLRMVRIGACVPEYEDESRLGTVLGRETSGLTRSWCGWCDRVILGAKDKDALTVSRLDSLAIDD